MFDQDVLGEPDEALIAEVRHRAKSTGVGLTDAQVDSWIDQARRFGARFVLLPGGAVIAEYEREGRR